MTRLQAPEGTAARMIERVIRTGRDRQQSVLRPADGYARNISRDRDGIQIRPLRGAPCDHERIVDSHARSQIRACATRSAGPHKPVALQPPRQVQEPAVAPAQRVAQLGSRARAFKRVEDITPSCLGGAGPAALRSTFVPDGPGPQAAS